MKFLNREEIVWKAVVNQLDVEEVGYEGSLRGQHGSGLCELLSLYGFLANNLTSEHYPAMKRRLMLFTPNAWATTGHYWWPWRSREGRVARFTAACFLLAMAHDDEFGCD